MLLQGERYLKLTAPVAERLQAHTGVSPASVRTLDDLERYLREQLDLVKARNERVIGLLITLFLLAEMRDLLGSLAVGDRGSALRELYAERVSQAHREACAAAGIVHDKSDEVVV